MYRNLYQLRQGATIHPIHQLLNSQRWLKLSYGWMLTLIMVCHFARQRRQLVFR